MTTRQQLFIRLSSLEEAIELIYKKIPPKPVGVEEIPLENALNRVLAEDVYSPISYPPYPRSIVDGYAVRADDVVKAWEDHPIKLRVKGELRIGSSPKGFYVSGREAIYVDTGSPIPDGADAVVPIEYTHRINDEVLVYRSVSVGENIAWPGSDVVKGEIIALKGTRLLAYHIGVLANVGIRKVKVYVKPRVAIISTGDELVEPGKELPLGKVYDSNSFLLKALIERDGLVAHRLGIVGDNEKELEELVLKAVEEYDAVLISGGTSAGVGDIVYRVLGKVGEVIVHGLKLKPGKPTVIAIVKNKPVFGLPGNPGSARNVYEVLVKPYLLRLSGEEVREGLEYVEAELALPVQGARGRRTYIPVILTHNSLKNIISAYPYWYESYMIKRIIDADGILIVGEDEYAPIQPGIARKIILLRKPRRNAIVGEESILLENTASREKLEMIALPSTIALKAVERGDAVKGVISSLAIRELPQNIRILERTNRKITLLEVNSKNKVPKVAWYPPGYGIASIQHRVYEKVSRKYVKVRVRGPLHAKLLLMEGQVDYAILPEEYLAEKANIVEQLGEEELLLIKLWR